MYRRQFLSSTLALAAYAGSAISFVGCTFESVFGQITQYVGVGIQAISSVVNLLAGSGIVTLPEGMAITAILALIKAGFADVSAAISEYDNAAPADKTSLKGKISTALQAVSDQIQKFWNDLKIPDAKLSTTVEGLLGIIVATIAGFMTQLPAPVAVKAVQLSKRLSVTPQKRTVKKFVSDFNNLLAQNGYTSYAIK